MNSKFHALLLPANVPLEAFSFGQGLRLPGRCLSLLLSFGGYLASGLIYFSRLFGGRRFVGVEYAG